MIAAKRNGPINSRSSVTSTVHCADPVETLDMVLLPVPRAQDTSHLANQAQYPVKPSTQSIPVPNQA